jgi:hypothetical protein
MGRIATKTVALRKPLTHMELDALRLGDEPPEDGADDELADVGEEPVVDPMLFVPDCSERWGINPYPPHHEVCF